MLLSPKASFDCCYLSGSWTEIKTDHKLIICDICLSSASFTTAPSAVKPEIQKVSGICRSTSLVTTNLKWNVDNLSDVKRREAFQRDLTTTIENYKEGKGKPSSVNERWSRLTSSLKLSASRTLNVAKSPLIPRRKSALDANQRSKFLYLRNPLNLKLKLRYKDSLSVKSAVFRKHREDKIRDFFENLNGYDPQTRLRMTFKFLRQFKKETGLARKDMRIPLSSWENELKKVSLEPQINSITETDNCPIGPPPTKEQILEYIRRMKSRTAPGNDEINVELLKNAPDSFIDELVELITTIWLRNEVPDVWLRTTQIPIPKIRNPKSLDDFRRITLCSAAYKIYATFLLERLSDYTHIPCIELAFKKTDPATTTYLW